MALDPVVSVVVSLNTTTVSKQGFGNPIFISTHSYFTERQRAYPSLDAALADIPADSVTGKALTKGFGAGAANTTVYVGRRQADKTIITPNDAIEGKTYSMLVNSGSNTLEEITYTAVALDTEEEIVTGLSASAAGNANIVGITFSVVGVGAAATLELVKSGSDDVVINTLLNVSDTYVSTETAATAYNAIADEGSDWYFVTAEDHTETFVTDMAATVEANDKLYFVSTQEQGSLAVLADPSTDILGKLRQSNYLRTAGCFHHNADTEFYELGLVMTNAIYDAGSVTWANITPSGYETARDPATGKVLTYTQRNNLASRNANFMTEKGGVSFNREGKVVSGEWIDK